MNPRNLLSHLVDKTNRTRGSDITRSDQCSRTSEEAGMNEK